MNEAIKLGKLVDDDGTVHRSQAVELDPMKLINSRMLIQGNSGAGKSWLMRLIAEQVSNKIQTIIVDTEGEFATLREKCDMALVGDVGEIKPNAQSAGLLARKLLELRVSAIIDIYDLPGREPIMTKRRHFVKLLLESWLTVPRALWRPMILMLDECHKLAPQTGDSEALTAVIDFGAQGRKRAFCLLAATQRMSKLHKDVTAELNNVIIGRCWQDVDRDRATDTLGMTKKEGGVLRSLPEGRWFGFGPAFTTQGVIHFQSDKVKTTHPKPGERHTLSVPKPSAAILQIAKQLEDLPQQAEEEARTLETAQEQISKLKRQVSEGVKPCDHDAELAALKHDKEALRTSLVETTEALNASNDSVERLAGQIKQMIPELEERVKAAVRGYLSNGVEATRTPVPTPPAVSATIPAAELRVTRVQRTPVALPGDGDDSEVKIGKNEKAILTVLARYPGGKEMKEIALLSGYRVTGSFRTSCSTLRTAGLIDGPNTGVMRITQRGIDRPEIQGFKLPKGDSLRSYWLTNNLFGKCEKEQMKVLFNTYWTHRNGLTMEEIAEMSESKYAITGSFRTGLSSLRTAGILTGKNTERMRASDHLFE